jgi:hypothetical protein
MPARYQARLRYLSSWVRPELKDAGSLAVAVASAAGLATVAAGPTPERISARCVWTREE